MVLLPPPAAGDGPAAGGLSVAELRAVALRQQQQLAWQQQQLVAREQRLRFLRQAPHEPQELKLRRLRAQLDQQQAGNASLAAELEAVRALFSAKEKELSVAAAKVEELTRQLEELRRNSSGANGSAGVTSATSGTDRARHEMLMARAQRAGQQREQLAQRQAEVQALDRRIAELRQRLHKKRLHNSQQQQQLAQQQQQQQLAAQQLTVVAPSNVRPGGCGASGPPPPLLLAANVAAVEPRPRSDPKYQTLPYNTKFRPAPPLQPPPPPPPLPPPNRQPEGSAAATEENSPPDQKKAKEADSAPEAMVEAVADDSPPLICTAFGQRWCCQRGAMVQLRHPLLCSRSEPRSVAMDSAPPSPPESSDSEEEKEETRNAPDRDQEQVKEDQQPQQHTASGEGSASETDGSQSQPVALPEPQQRPARGNLRSSGSTGGNGGRRKKGPQRVSFDPLALLLDAALEGELDLVRTTAAQVPNPSAANDEGITALHNAICAGHLDIVKFLVEFGCDVNAQDSDGWTPLHCAASCNNLAMVRFLVEHGACVFAATLSDHETAADKCEEDEEGFDSCSEYLYGVQEKLGVINGGVAYAVFDYEARQPDELTFGQGDMVQILRRGGAEGDTEQPCGWWWARLRDGREGYLPRNLLGLYPRVQPCRPSPEE
ncbi:ankyrin-repeat, SH3-domain, and Proline-rich-region containing Protein isoform X2 [Rhipicephalus microplus]|uniref:ankyrin-repeat, SH3-domain, and Proline-rich-region containing Protein isoform X2 n=1 Tax=Rhipicephalus microplus TaxID=6941 RepID=UPI003F6B363F